MNAANKHIEGSLPPRRNSGRKLSRFFKECVSVLCSIKSTTNNKSACAICAQEIIGMLRGIGFATQTYKPHGYNPIVFATYLNETSKKTILLYNHYDVVPTGDSLKWDTPPFELSERDNRLFARGIADDKGDLAARVSALRTLVDEGELSTNVKFIIEGNEETGSQGLKKFISHNLSGLKADAGIWEGGIIDDNGRPTISLGMKGLLKIKLTSHTAGKIVHSQEAGIVPNAAWLLVWALSSLRNSDGKIDVENLNSNETTSFTYDEIELINRVRLDEQSKRTAFGVDSFATVGKELLRKYYLEPTMNISYISSETTIRSGNIIPNRSRAILDIRLLPGQSSEKVYASIKGKLKQQFQRLIETKLLSASEASRTRHDDPFVRYSRSILKSTVGSPVSIKPIGVGSGSQHLIRDLLSIPLVSPSVCIDHRSNIHGINESASIRNLLSSIDFFEKLLRNFEDFRLV